MNKEKKTKKITVRCTGKEYQQILNASIESNNNLSDYILENLETRESRRRRYQKKERNVISNIVEIQQIINNLSSLKDFILNKDIARNIDKLKEVNEKLWVGL